MSLAWAFYDPYEEYGKETERKWYFCTFYYTKKTENMNEGMTGMILYNKMNTLYVRNHVATAHKRIFHTLFLT